MKVSLDHDVKYGLVGIHLEHSFSKDIHEQLGGYSSDLINIEEEDFTDFTN